MRRSVAVRNPDTWRFFWEWAARELRLVAGVTTIRPCSDRGPASHAQALRYMLPLVFDAPAAESFAYCRNSPRSPHQRGSLSRTEISALSALPNRAQFGGVFPTFSLQDMLACHYTRELIEIFLITKRSYGFALHNLDPADPRYDEAMERFGPDVSKIRRIAQFSLFVIGTNGQGLEALPPSLALLPLSASTVCARVSDFLARAGYAPSTEASFVASLKRGISMSRMFQIARMDAMGAEAAAVDAHPASTLALARTRYAALLAVVTRLQDHARNLNNLTRRAQAAKRSQAFHKAQGDFISDTTRLVTLQMLSRALVACTAVWDALLELVRLGRSPAPGSRAQAAGTILHLPDALHTFFADVLVAAICSRGFGQRGSSIKLPRIGDVSFAHTDVDGEMHFVSTITFAGEKATYLFSGSRPLAFHGVLARALHAWSRLRRAQCSLEHTSARAIDQQPFLTRPATTREDAASFGMGLSDEYVRTALKVVYWDLCRLPISARPLRTSFAQELYPDAYQRGESAVTALLGVMNHHEVRDGRPLWDSEACHGHRCLES